MSITLTISNIGAIEHWVGRLTYGSVLSVEADNAKGKSTIAACLAACLCRVQDPLRRGAQRHGSYVRRGSPAEASWARLECDDGNWEIIWSPVRGISEKGDAPRAPLLAVLDPAERGKSDWLQAIVGDPITHEQLTEELIKILGKDQRDAADKHAKAILADEPESWSVFQGVAEERRSKAKREWQDEVARTGEHATYGSAVAAKWTPREWTAEHEGLTPATCDRRLADAKAEFDSANSALASLNNLASEHADYIRKRERQERHVEDLEAELKRLDGTTFGKGPGKDEIDKAEKKVLEYTEILRAFESSHDTVRAEIDAAQAVLARLEGEQRDIASAADSLAARRQKKRREIDARAR